MANAPGFRPLPAALAMIVLAIIAASPARCADPAKARMFLVWLYSHYPSPAHGQPFDPTGRAANRVFDPPMIALMRENERLTPPGDVGAIDGDPVCDCQDDDGLAANIGPIRAAGPDGASAAVDLRFTKASPPELRHLRFDLVVVDGQWRIHDIHTADTPSLRAYLIQANHEARAPHP